MRVEYVIFILYRDKRGGVTSNIRRIICNTFCFQSKKNSPITFVFAVKFLRIINSKHPQKKTLPKRFKVY